MVCRYLYGNLIIKWYGNIRDDANSCRDDSVIYKFRIKKKSEDQCHAADKNRKLDR